MVEYIPCHSELGSPYLSADYSAGKYLLSKISKSGQGQHSVYSVVSTVFLYHTSSSYAIAVHVWNKMSRDWVKFLS
jgi:hypothetical protein